MPAPMPKKGWAAKIYLREEGSSDFIEIGTCKSVTLNLDQSVEAYYEIENPNVKHFEPGIISGDGTLNRAWINTYYLKLLGIPDISAYGPTQDCFLWSNNKFFDLCFNASEGSSGPIIYLYYCKFKKVTINIPSNGWLEENYDFILGAKNGAYGISIVQNQYWNLEVKSSPTSHDTPDPTIGVHSYLSGASVTASVTSPVAEDGYNWVCLGWTGTGSVPASGTTNTVTFTITQDSSITWLWEETTHPIKKQIFIQESTLVNTPDVIYKINFDDYDNPWIEDRLYLGITNDNSGPDYGHQNMCIDDDYIYFVSRVGTNNNLLSIRKIKQSSMGHVVRTTEAVAVGCASIEQKGDYLYLGVGVLTGGLYLKIEKRLKSDLSLVTSTDLNLIGVTLSHQPYKKASLCWDSIDPDILWIGSYDSVDGSPYIIKFDISTMTILSWKNYSVEIPGFRESPYIFEDADYLYATFEFYPATPNMMKVDKTDLSITAQTGNLGSAIRSDQYIKYITGNNIYISSDPGTPGIYKRSKIDLSDLYSLGESYTGALLNFADDPLCFFLTRYYNSPSPKTRIVRVRDNLAAFVEEGEFIQTDYIVDPQGFTSRGRKGVEIPMTPIPSLSDFAIWTPHILGNLSQITRTPTTTCMCDAYDTGFSVVPYAYITQTVGENKDIYCKFSYEPYVCDLSGDPLPFFLIQTKEGKTLFALYITYNGATQEIWCFYYDYPNLNTTFSIGTISLLETAHIKVYFKTGPGTGKYYVKIQKGGFTYTSMHENLKNDDSGPITDLWLGALSSQVHNHIKFYYHDFLCHALLDSISNGDFELSALVNWTTNDPANVTVSRPARHTKARGCKINVLNGYIEQTLATPVLCSEIVWFDIWLKALSGTATYSILATYTDLTTTTIIGTATTTWATVNVLASLNPAKTLKSIRIIKTQADPSTLYVDDAQCITI